MKRSISYACGILAICCAFGLVPRTARTAALDKEPENGVNQVTTTLLRRDYPEAQYASYMLEIHADSGPVAVGAYLYLRQDSRKLATIPLLPIVPKNAKGSHSTFLRVNCVANDQIDDTSYFYIFVSDPATDKRISEIKVLFRDAKSVERLPDAANTVKVVDFQFDGVWKPKGAMLRGVLLPPPALDAITLIIEDGKYEVTVKGEEHSDKGTIFLDETVTPKRMAIKSMSGPNKGKIILAIYEIKDEDAMRVCYDLSGKAFPIEFKAPKESDFYLAGYRRQKAEQPEEGHNPTESEASSESTDQ